MIQHRQRMFAPRANLSSIGELPSGHDPAKWTFSEDDVIGFLRFKLKSGAAASKRLMIVKGLILYRNKILRTQEPRLELIRAKLQEISVREQNERDSVCIARWPNGT